MARLPKCCQLCNWEGRPKGDGVPLAVSVITNLRLCAKHVTLLKRIAKDAGQRVEGLREFAA